MNLIIGQAPATVEMRGWWLTENSYEPGEYELSARIRSDEVVS